MTRAAMYIIWTDSIVPTYTSHRLTKPADRIHAVATIFSVFERRLQTCACTSLCLRRGFCNSDVPTWG